MLATTRHNEWSTVPERCHSERSRSACDDAFEESMHFPPASDSAESSTDYVVAREDQIPCIFAATKLNPWSTVPEPHHSERFGTKRQEKGRGRLACRARCFRSLFGSPTIMHESGLERSDSKTKYRARCYRSPSQRPDELYSSGSERSDNKNV
jgi:hypothetical protein